STTTPTSPPTAASRAGRGRPPVVVERSLSSVTLSWAWALTSSLSCSAATDSANCSRWRTMSASISSGVWLISVVSRQGVDVFPHVLDGALRRRRRGLLDLAPADQTCDGRPGKHHAGDDQRRRPRGQHQG